MHIKTLAVTIGLVVSASALTTATLDYQTYAAGTKPSAVAQTFYEGPTTRGFAWQTDTSVAVGKVWLLTGTKSAANAAEFLANGTVFEGSCTALTTPACNSHQVAVTGLTEGTTYSYRLGAGDANDVYGTFTVKSTSNEVTALFLSDAQPKELTKLYTWENTVSNAAQTVGASNLDFVLYGGDLYDENAPYFRALTSANDAKLFKYRMWGLSMDTATPYLPGIPWAMASGNHDYTVYAQATTENRAPAGGHSFDYGPVHVVTIPYLGAWSDQYVAVLDWLHADLQAATSAKWKVVAIHWGPYVSGDHYMDIAGTKDLIKKMAPICASNHVDLVFQGHDHVFTKTLPYRWDAAGYTESTTDNAVVNLEPETVTVQGTVYDHNPNGTFYVCTGSAGHRVAENTAYAELSASSHCYTNGQYKIVTDVIDVDSAWGVKGDNASHDLAASMFGVLKVTDKTLSYDFYVVATNGLAAPVLYDTLRVYKGELAPTVSSFIYRNDSGITDLTDPNAWSDGVVPGADDVAVFDGPTPATLTLGTTTSWAGIVRTNTVNALKLQAPADATLSLGAKGVQVFSENDDYQRFVLDVDLTLAADQTWLWGRNKTPEVKRSVMGAGRLTLSPTLNVDGKSGGNFVVSGPVRVPVETVAGVRVFVLERGSLDPSPTVKKGAELLFIPGETAGTYAFSDVFPSRAVNNAGTFHFGGPDTDKNFSSVTNVVTLSATDSLRGPSSSTTARDEGHVRVQDTQVVSDGADVTGNVWFDLRSGAWTQKSGDTAFTYGAIVGRGSAKDYGLKNQRLALEGGTFGSRRLVVGLGNGDSCPAEMRVSGGEYVGSLIDADSGNWWAGGLSLAPRSFARESTYKSGKEVGFSDSEWASARLDISAGRVSTSAILFGNNNNEWGMGDYHSGVRVGLTGGRLEVGKGGLRTADAWRSTDATDPSWYDVVLSGGTLAFTQPVSLSKADMRLSDKDGGVAVEVPNTITDVAITGSLYGNGSLRKTGGGCLQLRGANDYTGRTDVVEGRLVYGDRFETAVWTGDACKSLAEGAAVNPWTNVASMDPARKWSFGLATTIDNTVGTTAPTLARNVLNGHDALAFNGSNTAFLTGSSDQPISGKDSFTVSLVIQTEPGFVGSASTNIYEATQIFGTSINASWDAGKPFDRLYGIAIDDQGHLGCGMFGGRWKDAQNVLQSMADENLWATNNVVNDGKPHVITWSWEFNKKHTLRVDDQVYSLVSPSNGVSKTAKTRIVLGVGERQKSPIKRFKGYLADLRMAYGSIAADRCQGVTRELGIRYGVEAFADEKMWNEPEEVVRAEVPAPTAVWSTDSLTQTAGQPVNAWAEKSGKGPSSGKVWTFTKDLGNTILSTTKEYPKQTTAPVISSDTLAGHKMVSFNGRDAALGLTGSAATPVGNKDGLTVAMVVRFREYGQGGGAFTPSTSSPFFGSAYGMSGQNESWQLMVSGSARFGVSHRYGDTAVETLRSHSRFLNDGAAHIIVVRYPKKDTDDTLTMFIDGTKETSTFKMKNSIYNTRILLGASEYEKCHYAPIDVAEFRIWGGTVLSDDQVLAVGEDLASTYGLDLPGATRGKAVAGQQMSREVVVHEGAIFGGLGNFGAMLYPGQTLWGAGTASGPITLTPGAAVKATTTSAFTFTDGLTLMDGAALAAEFAAGESLRPVAVTGDLTLHGNVVVRLSVPEGVRPMGTLLTWTGNLITKADPTFTVEGVRAAAVQVKLDSANKCIKVVPLGGMQIIIR